ncbi:hypothetical protein O3P69_013231 [Scylla paramamosain]|uniref:Uncharacterized protein n=1 Tax=Scylla paramamosain TaxID=85552 RepID=A0AAW0TZ30_SCYPA
MADRRAGTRRSRQSSFSSHLEPSDFPTHSIRTPSHSPSLRRVSLSSLQQPPHLFNPNDTAHLNPPRVWPVLITVSTSEGVSLAAVRMFEAGNVQYKTQDGGLNEEATQRSTAT